MKDKDQHSKLLSDPSAADHRISTRGLEDELRAAQEYTEMIVDIVREGLLVLTSDLRVKSANQSFYEQFQVTSEETEGRLVYELGNGQWDIPALRELLEEILPHEKIFNDFKVEHDFEDLGHRVMLLNARQLDHHQLILLAIEDVTDRRRDQRARRESENWFRLLVDNAKEYAIFGMDEERQITRWSRGAERILGWSQEEVLGESGELVFTPEDRQEGIPEREIKQAKANGSSVDERWHLRKDGSRFWASGYLVALQDSGQLRGFAKIMRDNTERKQAEEQRKALLDALVHEQNQLERLNATLEERVEERTQQVRELASTLTMAEQKERRRIAEILHDDLQQLLYGIRMQLTFIKEDAAAADRGELGRHAEQVGALLGKAIETTRQLSVDLSPPVLKGEGFTEVLKWLASQMRKMYGLEVEVAAERPVHLPDEDMRVLLLQIVRELLFNVVKHAGVDQAAVELREEDGYLVIRVRDEGDGFNVEQAECRAQDEQGFGLFKVRERLGLFGGHLEIESAPGAGAQLIVRVPLAPENTDPSQRSTDVRSRVDPSRRQ